MREARHQDANVLTFGGALSRRDFLRGFALAGVGLAGGMSLLPREAYGHTGGPAGLDSVQHRAYDSLKVFTDWLGRERVRGFVGEVNWPNMLRRTNIISYDDSAQWNALGEQWYRWADAAGLWTTLWCVDERQLYGGFWLTAYTSVGDGKTRPISRPSAQAPVLERHPTTAAYKRGINVSGAEKWEEGVHTNANRGTYDSTYWYAGQETMNYLASRGTKVIRLPFRLERVQPQPGGALDSIEISRLKACVSRARTAGLGVILDMHNYAQYWVAGSTGPVALKVGSPQLPHSHFSDVWRKLSETFKDDPTVVAYDLMNEPYNHGEVPSAGYPSPQRAWEVATQSVVGAVRGGGDGKLLMIPGYAHIHKWSTKHPSRWIADAANNLMYTAHHYFDAYRGPNTGGGKYRLSYNDEIAYWKGQGY